MKKPYRTMGPIADLAEFADNMRKLGATSLEIFYGFKHNEATGSFRFYDVAAWGRRTYEEDACRMSADGTIKGAARPVHNVREIAGDLLEKALEWRTYLQGVGFDATIMTNSKGWVRPLTEEELTRACAAPRPNRV